MDGGFFPPCRLRLNYLDAAEGSAACTVQPFVCPWALFCFRAVHVSRRADESWVEWKQEYCLSCSWDFYVEVHWKHALWHWTSLWARITALRKRMRLLSGVGNSMALLPDELLWVISKGQYPCLIPEESSGVFLCWTGGMWACECVAWWSFSTRLHVNTEYQQWSWHTAFLLKLAFYTFFMCVCQLADGIQRLAWSWADGSHQSRYFTFPGSALWSLPWSAVPCSPHGTRSRLGSVGGSLSCESVSPGKGIAPAWLRRREAQFGEICWESKPLMRKAWAGWE